MSIIDNNTVIPVMTPDNFRIMEITETPFSIEEHRDWAIKHMGLDKLPYRGRGQRVGVLDTGCDKFHQDLDGQVTAANFISGNKEDPPWRDCCGHGCIQPDARTFTSLCGLSSIAELYAAVPVSAKTTDQGFETKDVSSLDITTISWSDTAFTPAKITSVHKLKYSGDVYRVRFQHGYLLLTPWHPLYVQTSSRGTDRTIKRVRADELKPTHKLIFNTRLQAPSSEYVSLAYTRNYNSHGVGGDVVQITLDSDIAWLAGLILTDGHVCDSPNGRGEGRTRFATISQGVPGRSLLERAAGIIERRFGLKCSIVQARTALELKVYSRGFVEFMLSLGIPPGNKSKIVDVPRMITASPVDVILAFVGGCIDGDGCVSGTGSKAGYIRITSASKTFADTLSLLLRSVGVWSNVVFNRGSSKSTYGSCDMYHVCLAHYPVALKSYVHHRDKRRRLRFNTCRRNRSRYSIIDITSEKYTGDLYDLTVDGTHNYLAEGVVVSNTFCTGEIVAKEDGRGIVGAAPLATAFHGRVLYGDHRDNRRSSGRSDIANAIRGCVADGCGVISMSIGGPGQNSQIRSALEYAVGKGVIPVAAAGNERLEGSPYASYPASYPTVISVASSNSDDMPAWFSTIAFDDKDELHEMKPEIAVSSKEFYWGCIPGRSAYGKMIGTSMATPLVAATALLWREARLASSAPFPTGENVLKEFRAWLKRVANDTNKNGWDPELGYGVLLLEDGEL